MTYSIEEAKEFVIKAGYALVEAGLVARTWGNISARISDHQFVITPSGRSYDTLTPEDIVIVNIEDGSYEGKVKPSGEKGVHAIVYRMRPQVNFVIHTHQNYASALSILGETVSVEREEDRVVLSDRIPCAEYGMYATKKLVMKIQEQLQLYERCKAVLMKYHGALCMGKDYEEAFRAADVLEKVCQDIYEEKCGILNPTEAPGNYEIDDALKGILERKDGSGAVKLMQTPFILAVSKYGKRLRPYLDDVAQIAGTDVKCIRQDANTSVLLKALEKRNAVLIKGVGAVCTGGDDSEAQAVGVVLEKASMASYFAYKMKETKTHKVPPLPLYNAWKDRKGYVSHYSKLK